ncbi:MAG: DUF2058 family protein [Candidatus Lambdaproteobacteria bacterium]|nr:DUF2058 family protein [Candidatus Lambdaproteobacteria bacterium]
MADLKDQLLKAGLIDEKQARQARHQRRVETKQLGREELERRQCEEQERARRQQAEQAEADRQRAAEAQAALTTREARLREQQKRETAIQAAYREGELPSWEGTRIYYFVDGKRVEMLQVTEDAARRLAEGGVAICRREGHGRGFTLLNAGGAEKLRAAAPERVVAFHRGGA